MGLTEKQQRAVDTRDKTLLVSAAAGSGKTSTLTERIIASLLDKDNPADLTRMMIVTFTNAATADLKAKISAALTDALKANPKNERLSRQLNLLPAATIKTIHSFCNDILKNVAESIGLPVGYRVPDVAEVRLLSENVMTSVVEGFYQGDYGDTVSQNDFAELADCLSKNKSDTDIEKCLLYVYEKTESHEYGVKSLYALSEKYDVGDDVALENTEFGQKLIEVVHTFAEYYREIFRKLEIEVDNLGYAQFAMAYRETQNRLKLLLDAKTYSGVYELLKNTELATEEKPKKDEYIGEIKKEIEARFTDELKKIKKDFFSYSESELKETFKKLRKSTKNLYLVLEKFDSLYREEKKRLGICEYSDMEYYTYHALYNEDGSLTDFALSMREDYDAVYIDEYQDVNPLQSKIFDAISKENNRFMVGDVKQSIYRFRNADPSIFLEMKKTFPDLALCENGNYASLFMSENFRCDEPIINFVNGVFDTVFLLAKDSISYVEEDKLKFKKVYNPGTIVPHREVEIIHVNTASASPETETEAEEAPIKANRAEARAIAEKIKDLMKNEQKNGVPGVDDREIHYKDIAILLNGFRGNAADYLDVLEEEGIPVQSKATPDILNSPEVLLTLCILGAIDNPCRDIYLTGAMISPIFGFTADEIAVIRKETDRHLPLYRSLLCYIEKHPDFDKGIAFVKKLENYRSVSENLSIERFLYRLYRETGLFAVATEHGRQTNLLRLYEYARSFELSSYRGLYSFISFLCSVVENKTEFEMGEPSDEIEDKVQLLTIHKSKGLEYPVVFLAGTASNLNQSGKDEGESFLAYKSDFGISLLTNDETGLSLVKNPVFALINRQNRRDEFEEKLRVLYVALTRAREKLIITGRVEDEEKRERSLAYKKGFLNKEGLYRVSSFLDLIELSGAKAKTTTVTITSKTAESEQKDDFSEVSPTPGENQSTEADRTPQACVNCPENGKKTAPVMQNEQKTEQNVENPTPALVSLFTDRFDFDYPNIEMTKVPEKISVSYLYPGVLDDPKEETLSIEEASMRTVGSKAKALLPNFYQKMPFEDGKKRGIATHQFMQFCDFSALKAGSVADELERLVEKRFLSRENAKFVHLDEVEKFKNSALLDEMIASETKYREFRFNVTLPAPEFTTDEQKKKALAGKEILVQGVIDCLLVTKEGEFILIDYKTDRLSKTELQNPALAAETLIEKHKTQLSYYAKAVEKIFGKYPSRIFIYSLHLGETVEVK